MNTIVTVASGVIAVYILLALVAAHFSEVVAALLKQRGKALFEGLDQVLGKATGDVRLVTAFYAHPNVDADGSGGTKPSYLPLRTMTLTLVAVLRDEAAAAEKSKAIGIDPKATSATALEQLQNDLTRLQPAVPIAKSLAQLLQTTRSDYESALKAIDAWFDDRMDRISGVYKRWSAGVQAVVALLVVVVLNVDTFAIVQELSKNAELANALTSAASSLSGAQPSTPAATQTDALKTLVSSGLHFGWTPIAWNFGSGAAWFGALTKVSGLFLTWAAVLLGAPFWFDLLSKVVPVRLAGAKPDDAA